MDVRHDPIQERLVEAVDAALSGTREPATELAELGVPALSLPESHGGYGLGLSADVVVHGRLGYALEPVPAIRETVLALDLVGADDVPADTLRDVVEGRAQAVVVGLRSALRLDDEGRVRGDTEAVPEGRYGLVVAQVATGGGDTRWAVVLPDATTARLADRSALWLPHLRLSFQGTPATVVEVSDETLATALDRARIRQAAVLLGVADRALETARSHVNRRIQYGNPLVQLQTVAHRLARLVGQADGWRLGLHENAWRYDAGAGRVGDGALSLAVAVDHALECTRLGIQLHGVRGMLAHSTASTAYRIASVEATRMGPPQSMWLEAGQALVAADGLAWPTVVVDDVTGEPVQI